MPAGRHARPAGYPGWLGALTVAVLILVSGAATLRGLGEPVQDTARAAAAVRQEPEPRASRSYRATPAPKRHRPPSNTARPVRGTSSFPDPARPRLTATESVRPPRIPRTSRLNPDRRTVVDWALAQVGKPYAWGGNGPDAYDCSGLVLAAFAHAGYAMPRWSGDQHRMGNAVPVDRLDAGDLVAWPGHVAIYLGRGRIVEAALPGTLVRVRRLDPGSWFDGSAWGVSLDYSGLPRT